MSTNLFCYVYVMNMSMNNENNQYEDLQLFLQGS